MFDFVSFEDCADVSYDPWDEINASLDAENDQDDENNAE